MHRPVGYASRSLNNAESHYAQIEKEALAITWACERFSTYILGKHISIETDHKPLVPLLSYKLLDNLLPRVLQFRLRMMKFDYTIQQVPGKFLYIADALSRAPIRGIPTLDEIATQQEVEIFIDGHTHTQTHTHINIRIQPAHAWFNNLSVIVEGKRYTALINTDQLIATTVVTSFIQHNRHPNLNPLIPAIMICVPTAQICFYDCTKDLLLLSDTFTWLNTEQNKREIIKAANFTQTTGCLYDNGSKNSLLAR